MQNADKEEKGSNPDGKKLNFEYPFMLTWKWLKDKLGTRLA